MRIVHENTVYQLSFLPRILPVNCYFVEEGDGLTLIDAALPYSFKGILQAAKKIGKPIRRILITHAHEDHVGALDALKRELPDIPVYISARDSRILKGDRTLDPDEPDFPIRGVPKRIKTSPEFFLREGDQIGSLLALHVPGHTPGSMAFFDTRNKSLIVGDAFQTRGGIAVSGQLRLWFPFPSMFTWNKQMAFESARKIQELHPSLLAVGHGKMLKQPKAAIAQAIIQAERNLTTYREERNEEHVTKNGA